MPARHLLPFLFFLFISLSVCLGQNKVKNPFNPADTASFDPIAWKVPYTFPVVTGWERERFALPPGFAPSFSFAGVEDIRFHPGWGKAGDTGYWTYTYLWWLVAGEAITPAALEQNFRAYYTGLIGINIESRKIPADKLFPTTASVKRSATLAGDLETFTANINMLDYMAQKPMVLNVIVHVKNAGAKDRQAMIVEVSPQPIQHAIWQQMDSFVSGFSVSPY